MLTHTEILQKYISFFETRGHKRIPNSPLVPQNDPTTLFTSSGMQPLIPYLMGESHPSGTRLVDVQNCFRAQDIDEVGDNRHTTFFRMLGNWSLGDYFKQEQHQWFFEFLTNTEIGLGLNPQQLHVTVFNGYKEFPRDEESFVIWKEILIKNGVSNFEEHIHYYDAHKNWWSRAGTPDQMPIGEIGGPTSEVFFDFEDVSLHKQSKWKDQPCHVNCDCGRYIELGNSVFMTYKKETDGTFISLPKKNVDFGGGLERLLAAVEQKQDLFQTSLFQPIIASIEKATRTVYSENKQGIRIIADHLIAAIFIIANGVIPSNKEQGYILRRLIRRAMDHLQVDVGAKTTSVVEVILAEYGKTDQDLFAKYESIKYILLEELQKYGRTKSEAKKLIDKKYKQDSWHDGDIRKISADDAFVLYTTHGLSPTQIKSLGYTFDDQLFAQKMEVHQKLSRKGAEHKFRGGLADHQEKTIMGHTATHLLHQALRDVLGNTVRQTGSNITTERIRFDFNFDRKLTDEEIRRVEYTVNEKIVANLPVHFELLPTEQAYKIGAVGLFMDTYGEKSKIYFIGDTTKRYTNAYSIEFCGGPHVDFTGKLKSFKIIKQESLGINQKRIYAKVGNNNDK